MKIADPWFDRVQKIIQHPGKLKKIAWRYIEKLREATRNIFFLSRCFAKLGEAIF